MNTIVFAQLSFLGDFFFSVVVVVCDDGLEFYAPFNII